MNTLEMKSLGIQELESREMVAVDGGSVIKVLKKFGEAVGLADILSNFAAGFAEGFSEGYHAQQKSKNFSE